MFKLNRFYDNIFFLKTILLLMVVLLLLSEEDFKKLKKRDPDIFSKIYNEYKIIVYNFLKLKTRGNSEMTDELFSDVFHSAIISAPGLKNSRNIQGWLIKIAQNRYVDYIRKLQREKNKLDNIKKYTLISEEDNTVKTILKKEKAVIINIALEYLKPKYRDILSLKYIEEKSVKEIAIQIKKTESAVLSLLDRARKALRKEIARGLEDYY